MRAWSLLVSTAVLTTLSSPVVASPVVTSQGTVAHPDDGQAPTLDRAADPVAEKAFDAARSVSTLDAIDLPKLGTVTVAGIVGHVPGIRAETSGVDGFSSLTVRGLPQAADGARYLQIQEDGLPVLEFGDLHFAGADTFVRADLGLSRIEVLRGGAASTLVSNAPGGVINLISRTGEREEGSVRLSTGLDHDLKRTDLEYGAPLGEHWRFHLAGFYHKGEGSRAIGYTGIRGGQVKVNVTRQFADGFIRFYGKYLDDRQANGGLFPVVVGGTDAAPTFASLRGTDARRDTLLSRYTALVPGVDQNNNPVTNDMRNGLHGVVKAVGLEGQFAIADWTFAHKFRFAANSGEYNEALSLLTLPAATMAAALGAPGGVLRYAGGPRAGEVVSDPAGLDGNGLLTLPLYVHARLNNLSNSTNDVRASRVWALGDARLSTTVGLSIGSQNIDMFWTAATGLEGVASGGGNTRFDLATAHGLSLTDGGLLAYGLPPLLGLPLSLYHRRYGVNSRVIAPYAMASYQSGKVLLEGSLRLDEGKVAGVLYGADLGDGLAGQGVIDIDGNGSLSIPETRVAILTQPGKVAYTYHYLSWSAGATWRIADPVSLFARYSLGGRAAAERVFFSAQHDPVSGGLTDPSAAYDRVRQAEAGIRLRRDGVSLFLTGFWASTRESGFQIGADASGTVRTIDLRRTYSARGLELESEIQRGPFSLALGATYARARLDRDVNDATLDGHRPRHQPTLSFSARPQFAQGIVTLGATITGTTASFAQDSNILRQPGYAIVNPFMFVRPLARVELGLSAYNVFDKLAFVNIASAAIPASGIVNAQTLDGRTVTATVRFSF